MREIPWDQRVLYEATARQGKIQNEQELRELEDKLISTDLSSMSEAERIQLAQMIVATENARMTWSGAIAEAKGDIATQLALLPQTQKLWKVLDESLKKRHRPLKEFLRGRATDKMVQAAHRQGAEMTDFQGLSRKYDQLASSIPDRTN